MLSDFINLVSDFLWNYPVLLALVLTHLFMTVTLAFPQKLVLKSIRLSIAGDGKRGHTGLGALTMTLAATLGTGNIVGVSTAVVLGGPGAVLWCWLTGVFGMATAYGECYLGTLFRQKEADGRLHGGTMYALEKGLKKRNLACFYCICILISSFGVGATTQSNALAESVASSWHVSPVISGLIAAGLTGLVILGGVRKIEKICMGIVPVAGFLFISGCAIILLLFSSYIPDALLLIIKSAFSPACFIPGVASGGLNLSMRYGVARGLFTNEAGLGTSSISAAISHESPKTQALIQMSAVFWDTVVMCALTGIVIVVGLLASPIGADTLEITSNAFSLLPVFGNDFLTICLAAFALATLIGWSFFGEEAAYYLGFPANVYKLIYIAAIFLGAILPMELVWSFTDLINALLIIPSLICLLGLRKLIEKP